MDKSELEHFTKVYNQTLRKIEELLKLKPNINTK